GDLGDDEGGGGADQRWWLDVATSALLHGGTGTLHPFNLVPWTAHMHPKEDVDIMKRMGFDAYRFSISWSRIFPTRTGKVNWKGVACYNSLINYMLKIGITPYFNLYHYDLPEALEVQYGGLLNRKVV
ncbi:hypothetical protein E2562_028380, partial [Oryza meyeriana var. granulata]